MHYRPYKHQVGGEEIAINEGAFGGRPRSRRGLAPWMDGEMDGWKLTAKYISVTHS
jgi:hypothetical protein